MQRAKSRECAQPKAGNSLDNDIYTRYNMEIAEEAEKDCFFGFFHKIKKRNIVILFHGNISQGKEEAQMAGKNILTYAGLKKLEDELQDLKVNQRKMIAQKIKEAREQGDLSENAEYDAAKDEQRDIEARIEQIEKILKNVEVVDEDEVSTDIINVGCRVRVLDMEYDEEMDFSIVGSTEANSLKGKISNESPVGAALIGAAVGSVVSVETPAGVMEYTVLSIEKNV